MRKKMIRLGHAIFVLAAFSGLAACNTVEGVGKDLEGAGRTIQNAS